MTRKTSIAILAAAILAGLLPAVVPVTGAAGASAPGATGTAGRTVPAVTLCGAGEHLHVDGPWGNYVIKNNDFYPGTSPECITHYRSGPNFAVTMSSAHAYGSESVAYPNIYNGCSYNICARHSLLPAPVFRMRHPWVSWVVKLRKRGRWNANVDMWLSRHEQKTGLVTGAEVMLWFSVHGFAPTYTTMRIDGIRWHLAYWMTRSLTDPSITWPLIIFRCVRARTSVRHLAILPFFRVLRRLHLIHSGYWLDSLHAGFEIWAGGRGLRMQWFRQGSGFRGHRHHRRHHRRH